MIVDTHTHVISHDTARFPLQVAEHMPNAWVHEAAVDAEQLLAEMDSAGVDAAVLVQARTAYGYDNSYVAEARETAPQRLAATAIVDMSAPDRLAQLNHWTQERGVGGVRLFNIPPADDGWFASRELTPFIRDAAASGVRVSACILPPDLPALGRLLASAHEVPVALDHCGFVSPAEGAGSPQMRAFTDLAEHDNLRLKVTTTFFAPALEAGGDARDVLEFLCSVFGADRIMWGSDYPQHHSESYSEIVAFAKFAASRLSSDERAAFLGGTAARLWPEITGDS